MVALLHTYACNGCPYVYAHSCVPEHAASCAGGPGDPPRQPLELWVADAATGAARRLLRSPELGLVAVFDELRAPALSTAAPTRCPLGGCWGGSRVC